MPPTLKKLLATAKVLIPHTGPLTNDKAELCQRLKIDPATDQTSEQLRILVGNRCVVLLVNMQRWLEKENWPADAREGLVISDFVLGTADMRIIRALCDQSIVLLLLPLAIIYRDALPTDPGTAAIHLRPIIESYLDILTTRHPPSPPVGPSTRSSLPPTVVTQSMSKHMAYVIISTILLSYTPTIPPEVNGPLRRQLATVLGGFPPSQTIQEVSAALAHWQKGSTGPKTPPVNFSCKWPVYVKDSLAGLMAHEVRRPGGLRGLMLNLFGENAVMQGATAADTTKLHLVAQAALGTPPRMSVQEWIPDSMLSLYDIIAPLNGSRAPRIFIHSSCYTLHHFWTTDRNTTWGTLDHTLLQPIAQAADALPTQMRTDPLYFPTTALRRVITILQAITTQSPYAPDYLDSLIIPILASLFILIQGYQLSHPSFSYGIREIVAAWVAQADREKVKEVMEGLLDTDPRVRLEDVASVISLPDEEGTEA